MPTNAGNCGAMLLQLSRRLFSADAYSFQTSEVVAFLHSSVFGTQTFAYARHVNALFSA